MLTTKVRQGLARGEGDQRGGKGGGELRCRCSCHLLGGCSRCCRRCIHDPSCVSLPYCCSWLLLLALLLPLLRPLLL